MSQQSRLQRWVEQEGRPSSTRWVAVTGGKGGVGKTNLAVGLALHAASQDQKTILIDGDLGLANVDIILDLDPGDNLASLLLQETDLDSMLVEVAFGLRVLPGASGLTHMADLDPVALRRLIAGIEQLDRYGDLVLVDTGAGVSRSVIDFCEMCGEVLVVTTPEPTSIRDAYALIKVLQAGGRRLKISLVVNMAESVFEAKETARRIAEVASRYLGTEIAQAGFVLRDEAVRHAVRERQPFSLTSPGGDAARCVREVGQALGFDRVLRRDTPSRVLDRLTQLFRERESDPLKGGRE